MLRWAAVFLVISLAAGMLGYTNVAGSALDIAKILFFIFLLGAILLFIVGMSIFGPKSK